MNDSTTLLIKECRSGKRNAQLAIYSAYAKKLYFACHRIVGNSVEAEEAMQDAFLKIFTRLDQYKDEQNFEAWIHRIAVHTAIDYVRKQQVFTEELSENMAEPDTEETDETELEYSVEGIKKAVAQLPTGYRIILSLYLFEGYDMEEISTILNIKPASVRSQYLRAKKKLIDMISQN